MLLPAGGDLGLQPTLPTSFQVGGAATTGVGDQGGGSLSNDGLDALNHGQQVHRIAGLVAHPIARITW